MQSITSLPKFRTRDLKKVILRVDYNVPLIQSAKKIRVADSRRIEASYKTIDTILKKGGIPLIIAHLGKKDESLQPVVAVLKKKYASVIFITDDIFSQECINKIEGAHHGSIIVLENIRRYEGEEKNAVSFAKKLASFGDYYCNDAFSVSHRAHASIVGIPKYLPSFAGFQLQLEIKALTPALSVSKRPFVFILGGAKVATKLPLLMRFVETADYVLLSGAIVNNFLKIGGFEVGTSVVDVHEARHIAQIKKILTSPKVLLPVDVVVLRNGKAVEVTLTEVLPNDSIVDIGPQTTAQSIEKVSKAALVVWNGPTGWYEKGFVKATTSIAQAIIKNKTKAIIGGGDTGAVLEKKVRLHKDDVSVARRVFISTGGGATLDFLSKGTLPGIIALK